MASALAIQYGYKVANGIEKIRITGGEPLARKGCADLVAMLRADPPRWVSNGRCPLAWSRAGSPGAGVGPATAEAVLTVLGPDEVGTVQIRGPVVFPGYVVGRDAAGPA